VASRHGD